MKRYSKTLNASQGLPHAKALDADALAGGYQNYAHARRQLDNVPASTPAHLAFISVMWRERQAKANGQEILTVRLNRPLTELVKPNHLKVARHFGAFRFAAADHLAHDLVASSQSDARRRACAAWRSLTFMEATGLRPSAGRSRAYPRGDFMNAVPGHDHASEWFDPATKAYVYVDEPYLRAVEGRQKEREAWADEHGWAIVRSDWLGMYNPDGGCELYLAADKAKGFDLVATAKTLNALPPPFVEADWDGRSAPMVPPFFSPAAEAVAACPRPEPKARGKRGPNATVGYRMVLMRGERRRPATRMPVEGHMEVGRLLKSVIYDMRAQKKVYNALNGVRSDLDDWVQCEYDREELSSDVFFDLYYHEDEVPQTALTGVARLAHHASKLAEAKRILARHYPDCAPLRSMFKAIDKAATALQA
jgi:hypothetical protein